MLGIGLTYNCLPVVYDAAVTMDDDLVFLAHEAPGRRETIDTQEIVRARTKAAARQAEGLPRSESTG
jgi:hypothetical protein